MCVGGADRSFSHVLAANARIGPGLYLRRPDDLFRLMGIERARARRPALCEYLHREQLGVDFRPKGTRRSRLAFRALVRLVRTESYIPDVALLHAALTRAVNKSSTSAIPLTASDRLPKTLIRDRTLRPTRAGRESPAGLKLVA